MAVEKKYDPHVVVVWTGTDNRGTTETAAVEFPFKEDAEEKYELLRQAGAPKVVLAKVVKAHGEG